jgi:hypothetical protein
MLLFYLPRASTELLIIEIVGNSLLKFNMWFLHRYKAMSDVEGFPTFQQNLQLSSSGLMTLRKVSAALT